MNQIARLKFEFAYYDSAVQHVNLHITVLLAFWSSTKIYS